jgi:hypothetical protein
VKVGNFAPKDPLEGREKPEHGAAMGNTNGTSISEDVSTRLKRIADLSRQLEGKALLSLAHHIDVSFLRHAYALTRKDGAPGMAERRSAGGWKDPFSGGRIAAGRSDLAALGEHLPT